uniref:Uncharacterized protein n=1 Tax=Mus musculus TaxID=10090 RepID=Q8C9J1_MOUSE|nr:unnamed protein product [Mus musculus]
MHYPLPHRSNTLTVGLGTNQQRHPLELLYVRTGCPSRGYGGRRAQRTVPLPPNTLPESQTSAISRGVRRRGEPAKEGLPPLSAPLPDSGISVGRGSPASFSTCAGRKRV